MPDLRIENPTVSERFAAMFAEIGVALPLRESAEEVGAILAANGEEILVVDVENVMDDTDVATIVSLIVLAVNTCAGLRAEVRYDG